DVQAAARRAEAAHHRGGGVGLEPLRYLAEAEATRRSQEIARERAALAVDQVAQGSRGLAQHRLVFEIGHYCSPPGIRGALAAEKKFMRSSSSPASSKSALVSETVMASVVPCGLTEVNTSNGNSTPPRMANAKRKNVGRKSSPRSRSALRLRSPCCAARRSMNPE